MLPKWHIDCKIFSLNVHSPTIQPLPKTTLIPISADQICIVKSSPLPKHLAMIATNDDIVSIRIEHLPTRIMNTGMADARVVDLHSIVSHIRTTWSDAVIILRLLSVLFHTRNRGKGVTYVVAKIDGRIV